MLSKLEIDFRLLVLFFAGLFSGLSISSIFLIPLLVFGYYIFIKNLEDSKGFRVSIIYGLIFGFAFFLGSMHWIIFPFLVYEKHFYLAPVIALIFPALMGIFFSVAAFFIHLIHKIRNDYFFTKIIFISIILFFSELVRSFLFGGLPLSLTAHIWSFNHEFISIASYLGVFGLSFLTLLWITSICFFLKKKLIKSIFVILIFPSLLYIIPVHNLKKTENKEYTVRVIQPNINQKEKWDRNLYQKHFEKLIYLTNSNSSNEKIIVVWPEVALTLFLNEEKELIDYLDKTLPKNIILVTGSLRRYFDKSNYKIFNSFYVLDDEIKFYDKKKLVPFGEFIPFKKILKILKITPGSTDFSSGKTKNILEINFEDKIIFVEPSICYESIFQTFTYKKINLFINITNDAWFGKTTGPKQHLAATIFRSVEKGVPLIRSANSGISVIINKNGEILKSQSLNTEGFIELKIQEGGNQTFFMKYGNFGVVLLVLLFLFQALLFDYVRKYTKKD